MTLHDHDERFHVPPHDERRWQENLFFILWDTATRHGFMVHLQRVPALGWQEAQAVVSIGGTLGSATLRRPFQADAGVAEVAMTPVEPWREWRLQVGFDGAAGRGPLGFVFTEPSGPTPVEADLTIRSVLPPADFGQALRGMVDALHTDPSGPQMTHAEHYEQGGIWEGSLRIGDEEVTASGLFVRDHSWGPRNEQNDFKAFWTASCLDGGRVFCNAIGIPQADKVVGVGAVVDEHGARFTSEVAADYLPRPGVCSYDSSIVRYGEGIDLELRGSTQVHVPMYLPHSGPRRYDNNAISAVTMNGKAGFGVLEWADVLTPGEVAELDQHGWASPDLSPVRP
jgi:hypothetical protein